MLNIASINKQRSATPSTLLLIAIIKEMAMGGKATRKGIRALYAEDPLQADWDLFGRRSDPLTRRGFLGGLGTMSALLGAEVVFSRFMPGGLMPVALAETSTDFIIPGKHP